MYKIVKTDKSILQIRNFISSYLQGFLNLFLDTGIENEHMIISNYKNSSQILKQQILLAIENIFETDILPKKVGINGELSVIVPVGNFRLFVDYSEDKKEKIRYIENIEFYRK